MSDGRRDDREALARLIHHGTWTDGWATKGFRDQALDAADRILAAGWRPPEPQERVMRCNACGFVVDTRYAATEPTMEQGR